MADPADPRPAALRPGTRDPHRSRERALKVLFQADLRGQDPREALASIVGDPDARALLDDEDADEVTAAAPGSGDIDAYARQLVQGVGDHLAELDGLIESFARRWTVARMPVVDRNVLRLGAYELLHEDVSAAVVIDEALELAKGLSTDNSGRFVNGILESIRRWDADRPSEDADHAPTDDAPSDVLTDDAPSDDGPSTDDPPSEDSLTEG